MLKTPNALWLAACLSVILSSTADATVVDFNGLTIYPTNASASVGQPYLEDGFKLITRGGVSFNMAGGTIYSVQPGSPFWSGTPSVYSGVNSGYGSAFVLEKEDGGLFDLISIDAAAFQNHPTARTFNVWGYLSGGTSTYQSFNLDDSFTSLQTLVFNDTFKNLTKILFSSVYAQVDNININLPAAPTPTSVPLPTAAWTLLSGLIGALSLCSRRRTPSR